MAQKILVVDDNKLNRELARQVLIYHGYEILEAENGQEGVRLAKEARPDLILMDIQMPVLDGLEATRILRGDPETRHIKVLALTSYAMKGDREKAMAAGMDDYITKPIDIHALPVIVKKYILKDHPA